MPVIRLLLLVLTTGMTVITLIISVSVMLGMAWLAVAVPVLVVIGVIAAGRALWRRGGSRDASEE
jgi:hypothetical protein